tara:strand:- start:953 stop:1717 length:765 start_codon:yes stop_codon:yes gene_type:complete
MNSKQALDRIKVVLGLKQDTFSSYKIKEGGEFQVEGEIEVNKSIYIVTEEGQLEAPDGEFEVETGEIVKVKDGMVEAIKERVEEKLEEDVKEEELEEVEIEVEEKKFIESTLIDGTIVINDEEVLEIGQKLYVVTEDGRIDAPEGEHETVDGIIVTVDAEGIISDIKEKEEIEPEAEEVIVSEVVEAFTQAIEKLNAEIETLRNDNTELKEKFQKFSNQPATVPVMDRKGFSTEVANKKASKMDKLAQLRRSLK